MKQVESFLNDLNVSHQVNRKNNGQEWKSNDIVLNQLIDSTTKTLHKLQSQLDERKLDDFYTEIADLKFMIEYSDELNKSWLMIRAYSSALRRLLRDMSLKNTNEVYLYYEKKYGGRRILRDENWFEQNRWEFLDELSAINEEPQLKKFVDKRVKKLNDNFQVYKSEMLLFLKSLHKL